MLKSKVVFIGLKGLPATGGAATVGENLISFLYEDYDITVLSTSSHVTNNFPSDFYKQIVFPKVGSGSINTFFYYIFCLIHVMTNKYHLIHLHHAESGFITPLLRLKYKVIVTFHGVFRSSDPKFSFLHNLFFKYSERLNVKFASKVISVSKPDLKHIRDKYNCQAYYIPNGINIQTNISKLDCEKKVDLTFSAARIYSIKGLHLLLESLNKANQNLSLRVIGDLEQVASYKREIKKMSKNLNVSYVGFVSDKEKLMNLISESRIFIFPSLTEAMSMMLLEVSSLKIPIIASDIPANKAVFSEKEITFFQSNNSDDLAQKIIYVINNYKIFKNKSKIAYEKLINNYAWEKIANQYSNEYNKLL